MFTDQLLKGSKIMNKTKRNLKADRSVFNSRLITRNVMNLQPQPEKDPHP